MKGKEKWLTQGEYQEGKQQQKEKKEREKKREKGFPDRARAAAGPPRGRRRDKSEEMQMSSEAPPSHSTPISGCQQIQKEAWGEDSGDTDEVEV